MTRKQKYKYLIEYFLQKGRIFDIELDYRNPFELVIAVILSAQCTDKRVNKISPELFANFPTARHMAASTFEELYPYIKSISYPNNKTKALLGTAKMLEKEFYSRVPSDVEALQKLPGVGRKSAHVIAATLYNIPKLAVDTHVFRVARRIGLVNEKATTPLTVEKQLVQNLPKEILIQANHWLILHGRYTCKARNPLCLECPFTKFCNHYKILQNKEESISVNNLEKDRKKRKENRNEKKLLN